MLGSSLPVLTFINIIVLARTSSKDETVKNNIATMLTRDKRCADSAKTLLRMV